MGNFILGFMAGVTAVVALLIVIIESDPEYDT